MFFSAKGDMVFEERGRQTELLKNWLHESSINFGISNLNLLSLPVMVN
jgi:hypothetical protein